MMKSNSSPQLALSKLLLILSLIIAACSHSQLNRGEPMEISTQATFQKLRGEFSPGEITRLCKHAIDQTESELKKISELSADKRTHENTILHFESTLADLSDLTTPLTFMGYVSTHSDLNSEGSKCAELLGDYTVQVFTRRELYEAIKDLQGRTPDETRLISETRKSFEKNGLKLDDKKLATVRQWMQELNRKEVEFSKTLAQDTSSVDFTKAELEGVPDQFLGRLEKQPNGKFKVTTKSTDFTVVMENASASETRRLMLLAYMNRGSKTNPKLLEDAVQLRHQLATTLGFKSWADYQTQDRMATDSKTIQTFLNGLKGKLKERNQVDLKRLLDFKKKSEPGAQKLNHWDIPYYAYQFKKVNFNLDDEKVREYFPANHVISEMFALYSGLLGVQFNEVENAKTWSPEVKLYEVKDVKGSRKGQVVGYFYTDFIPRPLKYGHAAAFTLMHGRRLPNGDYMKPVSAIVANMNPPSEKLPSLLNHSEVVTLFHEFGHIMHQVLTHADYASLAGTSVARDFVEAPSQMLENWVWSPEILKRVSGHYLDLNQKLPSQMLAQLISARDFNQGYFYCRQLYFGMFDMQLHTASNRVHSTEIADRLFHEMFGIESIPGGNFPATFGHLMGGYDAGYYGYLWSEVYAMDMFSLFQSKGITNGELGLKYRQTILERGNLTPAMDLLVEFLGRKPNQEAFFKKLHIQ